MRVKVLFNRRKKLDQNGKAKIVLSLTWSGDRIFFNTGLSVYPKQFKSGRIVSHLNATKMNNAINGLIGRAEGYYMDKLASGEPFSLFACREYLKNSETGLVEFIQKRISLSDLKPSTVRQHNILIKYLDLFGQEVNTDRKVLAFEDFLKSSDSDRGGKLSINYVASLLRILKSYTRQAVRYEVLKSDPFIDFKIKTIKTVARNLSAIEVRKIEDYKCVGRLEYVKDRFLFMCYTGMRYGDSSRVDISQVAEGWLEYTPQKTEKHGTKVELPLKNLFKGKPLEILKRRKSFGSYELKEFNQSLLKIAYDLKMDKFTSKAARHSFTSILTELGVNISIIAALDGHASVTTTEVYQTVSRKAKLSALQN